MNDIAEFNLVGWDYFAFAAYFIVVCFVGFWVGRKKRTSSDEYFLAGHTLPWYIVGSSFIASNISSEHFIGMIGAAYVYGISIAQVSWGNIFSFTLLIWFFIPFLLAAKVFTTPEFLEKRFNPGLRQFFAIVTIISNVIAFLAAVLYGGGIALQELFGWNLWFGIMAIGSIAGFLAIYGGLKSGAYADFLTVIIMLIAGLAVTILGLYMLSGESHSLIDGFKEMIVKNRAQSGVWRQVVLDNAQNMVGKDNYNRLSVIQPVTHPICPWPNIFLGVFTISIWYNVLNQFMIQRVLGAKNMYHARMGIVFAGYIQAFLPVIIVIPGMIMFAKYPEIMQLPWNEIRPEADKSYVAMLQLLIPAGLRGLFLAALFGAIQSTVTAVLNSTSTIVTLDIYKRMFNPHASEKKLVRIGVRTSLIILIISIIMGRYIGLLGSGLFFYIQAMYSFFAPPFAAIFLLGILFRRINGKGATVALFTGFVLSILLKIYISLCPGHPAWIESFRMQSIVVWAICIVLCVVVSLMTERPSPDKITDDLTINWKKLNIFSQLGTKWYTS